MKPTIQILMAGMALMLIICSCQKAPIHANIEGFWKLESFTILETEETVVCERLYYSITRMVTEVSEKEGQNGYGTYIGRTEYRNNGTQLVLKDFKVRANTSDNKEDAPVEKLQHFGLGNQEENVFDIIECNRKTMTLESDYARLELKRF